MANPYLASGTIDPRLIPGLSQPQPAMPTTPSVQRSGMFGRGMDRSSATMDAASLGLPDMASLPTALPQANLQVAQPVVRPHFFDRGGTGQRILGALGEMGLQLAASQGDQASLAFIQNRYRTQQQEADEQRERARLIFQERLRRSTPQIYNGGDGQILSVNPADMSVSELHAARPAAPKVGEQQSLIDYWNSLPADDPRRPLIERAVRGYQYTVPVIQARQQGAMAMEDVRQQHRTALRGMPTYAQTHPAQRGGGGFAPTRPAAGPMSRVINGKTYYQIGGKWYDSPSGN